MKNKIISFFAMASFLVVALFNLTGCDFYKTPLILDTPVVVLTENIASWEENLNAERFEISINGELTYFENTTTTKELEDNQILKVRAIGDGINYKTSEWSNIVTYIEPQQNVTTGIIDFKAHGICYAVTNISFIDALNVDGNQYTISETFNAALNTLNMGTAHVAETDSTLIISEKNEDTDTSVYFDDLTYSTADADNIQPIQIVLTVQNRSMFNVEVDYAEGYFTNTTKRFADVNNRDISYLIDVNYGEGKNSLAPASSTGGTDGGVCTVIISLILEKNDYNYQETYSISYDKYGNEIKTRTYQFAKNVLVSFNVPLRLDLGTV